MKRTADYYGYNTLQAQAPCYLNPQGENKILTSEVIQLILSKLGGVDLLSAFQVSHFWNTRSYAVIKHNTNEISELIQFSIKEVATAISHYRKQLDSNLTSKKQKKLYADLLSEGVKAYEELENELPKICTLINIKYFHFTSYLTFRDRIKNLFINHIGLIHNLEAQYAKKKRSQANNHNPQDFKVNGFARSEAFDDFFKKTETLNFIKDSIDPLWRIPAKNCQSLSFNAISEIDLKLAKQLGQEEKNNFSLVYPKPVRNMPCMTYTKEETNARIKKFAINTALSGANKYVALGYCEYLVNQKEYDITLAKISNELVKVGCLNKARFFAEKIYDYAIWYYADSNIWVEKIWK